MISTVVSRAGGFINSVRVTMGAGAVVLMSLNYQTGISAFEALRMPMKDG